ncbi:MAG: DEAD/DEAH box helicase, partial [Candidatus Thorarchaeota archaeon]
IRIANIIKNAIEKFELLESLLKELGRDISHTIIYCSPNQIERVMNVVSKYGIIAHRFTMKEGTTPESKYGGISQRDFILNNFTEGKYRLLVSMRCLDEGVDIPSTKRAILMSSSGNPREYIQRIGRVIRRDESKNVAEIYDFVTIPLLSRVSYELRDIEIKIFTKELSRYVEIAETALNRAEVLSKIYDIKNRIMGNLKVNE